mmetsp:Transcript_1400/g.2229  ORF Transcript_1400/g.2229 Transcript_1400/m.2229 type:complete len:82 (+) Transcript_1400:468-713(+)
MGSPKSCRMMTSSCIANPACDLTKLLRTLQQRGMETGRTIKAHTSTGSDKLTSLCDPKALQSVMSVRPFHECQLEFGAWAS